MKKIVFVLTFFFSLFLGSNYVYANEIDDEYDALSDTNNPNNLVLLCKYVDSSGGGTAFLVGKKYEGKDEVWIYCFENLGEAVVFNISPDSLIETGTDSEGSIHCPKLYLTFIDGKPNISSSNQSNTYYTQNGFKRFKQSDTIDITEYSYNFSLSDIDGHNYQFFIKKSGSEYTWKIYDNTNSFTSNDTPITDTILYKQGTDDLYYSIDEEIIDELKKIFDEEEFVGGKKDLIDDYQVCYADSNRTTYSLMSINKNCDEEKENLIVSRDPFDKLLGDLKMVLPSDALSYEGLTINGKSVLFSSIDGTTICETEDCSDTDSMAKEVIKRVTSFCNNISNFNTKIDYKSDCANFNKFENWLYVNNYLKNDTLFFVVEEDKVYTSEEIYVGCDILTSGFKDKLNFYLNIFKIAAPILAVVLGMLDFTKVLVAGDADKEMKDAWRKFKVRLIAAAILFLVPVMLSTLINLFIGDEINNNPYCSLIDIETKS